MKSRFVIITLIISVFLPQNVSAGAIYLKSGKIKPTNEQSLAAESAAESIGTGYYIVLLEGPVQCSDKLALINAGAEILEYLPDFAFLIRIDHSLLHQLKKLDRIEWVGPFKSEYKSGEDLAQLDGKRQYIVTLFPGASSKYAFSKSKAAKIDCYGQTCRVIANGEQLTDLAKTNAVAWIEPYTQPRLCNNVASGITGVQNVRTNIELYGADEIVAIADAGLDTGNSSTISSDFAGRICSTYALRRIDDWSDLNGHGTHVAGSLLGSGVLSGSNPSTHSYNSSFAGVAPEAQFVFQSIGDDGSYVFPPLHLSELFQPAYDDGARIHSNSWGSSVDGEYTTYSNEVDQFMWDHKDFAIVYSVGNEAVDLDKDGVIDQDCLYAPATAKNCISVGATENLRTSGGYQMGYGIAWPTDYGASPIKYDLMSNNINGMVAFSGRGPTDDGRIKPDVCAPGTNIISCRTHASSSSTGWGIYDSNYVYMGGTSMATPQVAGAAALVREYYRKEKSTTPSAALVKATLINGAVDMSPGQYGAAYHETTTVPDFSQGWGRMNVENSLAVDPPLTTEFADETSGLSTGGYREYQFNVVDSSVPLKVTLAWTDYPGAVHSSKELVNDLDLTVTSPTGTVYPQGSKDRLNNVEQVLISSPVVGTYLVRVTGYNVPMGPQDYALVVSGGMPATYISGSVVSTTGAVVQGASVALMSSSGTKRVVTNQNGQYLSRVEPGTYSVQVVKTGWTFSPRGKVVMVVNDPVENVNFTGSGLPGSVSGTVTSVIGGTISHIVETPHPYLNNLDKTYTITANEGVSQVRVHFAEIDLMSDGDQITVMDSGDNVLTTYTGKGEDVWSPWVSGTVVKVRILTNDYGNTGYGFYIDGYETNLVDQGGVDGAKITLNPGGYQTSTNSTGDYSLSGIPPGTYTLTSTKTNWTSQPGSKTVDIPAGGSATDIDFQALPPGSITGQAAMVSSETHAISIESPHPYEPNYENTWQIDADPSTTRMRLHFSQLVTEPAWDYVYVMDANDEIVEIYTADYTDLWTPWVTGNVAKVMLTSDSGNEEYGFKIDKYETEVVGAGLEGALIQLNPEACNISTSGGGTFSIDEVKVGSHTLLPVSDLFEFDPESIMVNIAAGVKEQVLFYARLGNLTLASQAKMLPSGITITLKDVTVSAVFNGFFYVQDSTGISGIRVDSTADVNEGDVIDVTGTLVTQDGERRIIAE